MQCCSSAVGGGKPIFSLAQKQVGIFLLQGINLVLYFASQISSNTFISGIFEKQQTDVKYQIKATRAKKTHKLISCLLSFQRNFRLYRSISSEEEGHILSVVNMLLYINITQ